MRFTKKITAAILSLVLVLAVGVTCMAAESWGSYFGFDDPNNNHGYEAASGKLTVNNDKAFTATVNTFGWQGVWGGQVKKPVNIAKGSKNIIAFDISSSKIDKYVYIKISTGEDVACAFWLYLQKGKTIKVSKTFTAAAKADTVNFAIGGDAGDRGGIDADGEYRYKVFDQDFKGKGDYATLLAQNFNGNDIATAASEIKVTNFVLAGKPAKAKISKAKALGKGKVKVTWKKVAGANGYQVQVGTKKKTTTKTSYTMKKFKKGKKVSCKVRAYAGNKALYGSWSKAKKVKVK